MGPDRVRRDGSMRARRGRRARQGGRARGRARPRLPARALVGLRAWLRATARRPGGHRVSGYVRDGAEIYRRSFATIRAEADLDGLDPILERVVVRMIHACGMVDLVADVAASPGFGAAGEGALRAGAPILCDTAMVASGVTRSRLPAGNEVDLHAVGPVGPGAGRRAGHDAHRRGDRAVARAPRWLGRRRRQRADGAVPAAGAGRAGRRAAGGRDRRAGRVHRRGRVQGRAGRAPGRPGARRRPRPARRQRDRRRRRQRAGERGGVSRPAVRRRRRPRRPRAADVKAQRIVGGGRRRSPIRTRGTGAAWRGAIAAPHLRGDQIEVALDVPGHDRADRPPGRLRGGAERVLRRGRGAAGRAPRRRARRRGPVRGRPVLLRLVHVPARAPRRSLRDRGGAGRDVVQRRGRGGRDAARASRDDVLTVLPGTLPPDVLAARLRASDAAVVIKLGRTFAGVARRGRAGGRRPSGRSTSSARARDAERVAPLRDVGERGALHVARARAERRAPRRATAAPGRVSVVGLGPAGAGLADARGARRAGGRRRAVGYETYLARVPERRGQRRHATDNRVEAERARHALELAAGGARVAVVSSGDPGIFAMAAAVLEVGRRRDGAGGRRGAGRAGPVGDAGRGGPRRRAAGPRLLRHLAVGPAQAVGGRRAAARRGRRGRPRPRALQPRVADAARAARRGPSRCCAAIAPTRRRSSWRARSARRRSRSRSRRSATLDLDVVDMRTLLIVGSSTTRTIPGEPPRVYTPRRYPA